MLYSKRVEGGGLPLVLQSSSSNTMGPPGGGVEWGCSPQGQWLGVSFKVGLCRFAINSAFVVSLPAGILDFLLVSAQPAAPACPLSVLWPMTLINKAMHCTQPPVYRLHFLFLRPFSGNPRDDCALKSQLLCSFSAQIPFSHLFCSHFSKSHTWQNTLTWCHATDWFADFG